MKNLIRFLFLIAVFAVTLSGTTQKAKTATLPATDNTALMACSQVISFENTTMTAEYALIATMPVSEEVTLGKMVEGKNLSTEAVLSNKSKDLLMSSEVAVNLSGQKNAKELVTFTPANAMKVSPATIAVDSFSTYTMFAAAYDQAQTIATT